MKANRRFSHENDEAVSPVIAVILMVAITVVLAATVYIWVTSFSSNQQAPTQASVQASAINRNPSTNSLQDTIRLLLSNAPEAFGASSIVITVNGTAVAHANICLVQPNATVAGTGTGATFCDLNTNTLTVVGQWANGRSLYFDCSGPGDNEVVATVRNSVVHSSRVRCDE
ncbi:MAG TPA: type IV pilin N-terminal domain-containing protein [Candidatus Thermoplasmatota archaeon]|nr:type IV pilin N-terminal domain-containing protein [Candidatus Thermoplasmatota archaeon]